MSTEIREFERTIRLKREQSRYTTEGCKVEREFYTSDKGEITEVIVLSSGRIFGRDRLTT